MTSSANTNKEVKIMRKLIRREDPFGLIDPFFDDFFFSKRSLFDNQILKTDIQEEDHQYIVKIDVPEIKKEDIKLSLEEGYLKVNVTYNNDVEEKDGTRYIRRERRFGNFSRTFYVGEDLVEDDVKAKLSDGVLTLTLQKKTPLIKESKYIEIE